MVNTTWLATVGGECPILRKGELQKALQLAQRWLQTYGAADISQSDLAIAAFLREAFNMSAQLDDALALFERAWRIVSAGSL